MSSCMPSKSWDFMCFHDPPRSWSYLQFIISQPCILKYPFSTLISIMSSCMPSKSWDFICFHDPPRLWSYLQAYPTRSPASRTLTLVHPNSSLGPGHAYPPFLLWTPSLITFSSWAWNELPRSLIPTRVPPMN